MNLALWITAGFLAALHGFAGFGKLFLPQAKMAELGGAAGAWVLDFKPGTLKAIATLESLAAIGLILPALLDIAPILVPLAALGLVLLMTGAVIMRIRRHELKYALADLIYLALAAFVAFGRFGPEPFTS